MTGMTNEQRLEAEYPLETVAGVNAFLSNFHHIRSAALSKGDFDAIILLIDFETTCSRLKFTNRQLQAVDLFFFEDLTQREAGEIMGISQQAVQQLTNSVVSKIAGQYAIDVRGVRQGGEINDEIQN